MIRGTLFQVVEESMRFILSHLKVAFEIVAEIERREIYEYPLRTAWEHPPKRLSDGLPG
ncbi:MAG: hypothetical protein HZC52_01435 [Planctomycetes bacterium]|nr:hypothetical protein [Planctomycetota bacterium]